MTICSRAIKLPTQGFGEEEYGYKHILLFPIMLLGFGLFLVWAQCATLTIGAPGIRSLYDLDLGFQFSFVNVETRNGETYTGQIIGIYNEKKFMWHPTEFSTIALFACSDSAIPLSDFSVMAGGDPAIFSVSSADIVSILVVKQPNTLVDYKEYMRAHDYVLQKVPVEGEVYILEDWTTYHAWEDGRSNYAWDLAKLNNNMMTYAHFGNKLTDFEVFGSNIILPMPGKVLTSIRNEIDNLPDLTAAVELMDHEDGRDVDLEEKPQNMVELEIGGTGSPAMLRLLHMKEGSIPQNIQVGADLAVGTPLGQVGNSGTTFTPHLHVVFGFTDQNDRFWSLPVEWKDTEQRILLPYPHGYEYGSYHQREYFYPKMNNILKNF